MLSKSWLDKPIAEAIAHADLSDMPDSGGTNTDHDLRYWTLGTDQTLLTGNKSGSFDLTTTGDVKSSSFHAKEVVSGEMIANANFDTDTLFTTVSGTITYSSGSYTFLASAIKRQAFSDMLITPSSGVRRYKYEFVVSAASGTTKAFFPYYPLISIDIDSTGTYTGEFDAEITDPFQFGSGGSGNASVTIDSISIKEITKGTITADQDMTANAFITENGLSTDFVKGDGSLDGSTYLTTLAFAGLSDYPADSIGALTNDGVGNLSWTAISIEWSAIAGTQSDINISGFTNDSAFISDISGFTTDDLSEGSTNLYFSGKTLDDLSDGASRIALPYASFPADSAGVLTSDGAGNLSWAAGGGETIVLEATSGYTLPSASGYLGKKITIRNISGGDLTITPDGGDVVEEATMHNGESFQLTSDGASNWYLV